MSRKLTPAEEALILCFAQGKGCRLHLAEGDPVEFAPGSLGLFGKNVIEGMTVEGVRELSLADIERVEILQD